MMSRLFVFLASSLVLFVAVKSQYVVPELEFQALTPTGLRVSIRDTPGVKLFSFHGLVNEDFGGKESGTINGDILQPRNGRWIFEDLNVQLNVGDTIKYWVFVQHENLGYRKDKQEFTVKTLVPPNTTWPPSGGGKVPGDSGIPVTQNPNKACTTGNSVTTINDGKSTCSGRIIFEEKFNTLDTNRWLVEHRLPDVHQENPFVSYQQRTVTIDQNKLKISPKLQHTISPFTKESITTGTLDLTDKCTSENNEDCVYEAMGANILPPVVSGRISTKNSFSFKYGKVEVRAKLPQGDWIYPELYLMPTKLRYGTKGYESGVIRIAFTRGNLELASTTENLNSNVLSGGVLVDQFEPCRSQGIVKNPDTNSVWSNDYHVYGVSWEPDRITLSVDGKPYGTVVPPEGGFKSFKTQCAQMLTDTSRWGTGTTMAPFDKEFHIVIGVGVGGISDFPDNVGNKKWKNFSSKARSTFWKQYDEWYETWIGDRNLWVDSIKVTAI